MEESIGLFERESVEAGNEKFANITNGNKLGFQFQVGTRNENRQPESQKL